MKLNKKLAIVPAIALAAGISVTACSSGGSSGSSSGPALKAGTATVSQICKAMIGTTLQNTDTGQNTGTSIVSGGADINTGYVVVPLNSSGNEVVNCEYTLDTGALFPASVTLFANGSLGVTGN